MERPVQNRIAINENKLLHWHIIAFEKDLFLKLIIDKKSILNVILGEHEKKNVYSRLR